MAPNRSLDSAPRIPLRNYLYAAAAVGAIAAVGAPLLGHLDLANIVMLFPLAVLFSGIRLGRGPAVLAALLSVLLFNVFFVPPRFTLVVADLQYLLTFAVLLLVALITAHLSAGLRQQRDKAEARGKQAEALYAIARELSAALTVEQISEICERFVRDAFGGRMVLFVPGEDERLDAVGGFSGQDGEPDPEVAFRAYREGNTKDMPKGGTRYVLLRGPMRVRGVLGLFPGVVPSALTSAQEQLLDTLAGLLGIALERIHYVAVAQRTEIEIESERLRNSLLSALSHDLRTPLTAIAGLADSMALTPPKMSGEQEELANAIRSEALRTGALVSNLLDMARFQSGGVHLHREWVPLEEVVGAALQARSSLLVRHELVLDIPESLPMVDIDGVLMERVVCNLLENAAKYTAPGSTVELRAREEGDRVVFSVCDDGPGLPRKADELFGKFVRGHAESNVVGVGLGLSIVASIVKAHGGRLRAFDRAGGGACFEIELPAGVPPEYMDQPDE